ncbi:DUF4102 domain-containing protein [Vibrio cincinnatiensis]|nr:DUF4102 domain-containing protein [Vibrio cincinnatiensis]MCG3731985.1 DUF4102 domain-containing protein [Vibrio cincinnatiensis]MCG3739379.1 DUF4102 domain-containing protein [Vibrio cincinnatiensis]MCG3745375.1 DUF4102 domain-containing protein [Vibrio cincinnatiensis]MCG3745666.1 DUF4102 domain-containing protein [Vibrio cincinnatiensis]
MLTDTKLHNFKPKDKLYKVNDRDGLEKVLTEPLMKKALRKNT